MKKFLLAAAALALSCTAMSTMASAVGKPLSWILLSSNVVSTVDMNCVSNQGRTEKPMVITSMPRVSRWDEITGRFHGMNLQCTFTLHNTKEIVGSARIRVWAGNQPNPLSATIDNIQSTSGYALIATGSRPNWNHVKSFYNYTVTMNTVN